MPNRIFRCPLCGHCTGTKASLIKHCLEEVRTDVQYQCSRCQWKKPGHQWDLFNSGRHLCSTEGKHFTVEMHHKTLDEVKALLHISRDIHSREVDEVARQLDWRPPRNMWLHKRKHHAKPVQNQPTKMVVVINSPYKNLEEQRTADPKQSEGSVQVDLTSGASQDVREKKTRGAPSAYPVPRRRPAAAQSVPDSVAESGSSELRALLEEIGPPPSIELEPPPPEEEKIGETLDAQTTKALFPTAADEPLPSFESFLTPVHDSDQGAVPSPLQTQISAAIGASANPVQNCDVTRAQGAEPSVPGYDPCNPGFACGTDQQQENALLASLSAFVPSSVCVPGPSSSSSSESTPSVAPSSLWSPFVRYPNTLLPFLPDCRPQVGVVALSGGTSYFYTGEGEKYFMFPTIHRATGSICMAMAPARNCNEAAVLRDCPELSPYAPAQPADMDWVKTVRMGVPFRGTGTLLAPYHLCLEDALEKLK